MCRPRSRRLAGKQKYKRVITILVFCNHSESFLVFLSFRVPRPCPIECKLCSTVWRIMRTSPPSEKETFLWSGRGAVSTPSCGWVVRRFYNLSVGRGEGRRQFYWERVVSKEKGREEKTPSYRGEGEGIKRVVSFRVPKGVLLEPGSP